MQSVYFLIHSCIRLFNRFWFKKKDLTSELNIQRSEQSEGHLCTPHQQVKK